MKAYSSAYDKDMLLSLFSQVEQVVEHRTGVLEIDSQDVAKELEAPSELSGSEAGVLVEVESEESGRIDVTEALTSQETLELGNRVGEPVEVAVEEVVVLVDELQVHSDQEGKLGQVESVGTEGEVSKLKSGIQEVRARCFCRGQSR